MEANYGPKTATAIRKGALDETEDVISRLVGEVDHLEQRLSRVLISNNPQPIQGGEPVPQMSSHHETIDGQRRRIEAQVNRLRDLRERIDIE